jgi:hypothetical protein
MKPGDLLGITVPAAALPSAVNSVGPANVLDTTDIVILLRRGAGKRDEVLSKFGRCFVLKEKLCPIT